MDIEIFKSMFPILCKGSIVTIELTVISVILGSIIGVVIGVFKLSNKKILTYISCIYIWIFRGTPLFLQLFVFYYGLPFWGIILTPWKAAIVGLSLNAGAYMAEIIRGGILSIDKGQFEAGKALGLKYKDIMLNIIFPQAFRVIIPSIANQFINILKDTSLVSVIAMEELMRHAQLQMSFSGRPVEPFIIAAILYLVMTTVVSMIGYWTEKRVLIY